MDAATLVAGAEQVEGAPAAPRRGPRSRPWRRWLTVLPGVVAGLVTAGTLLAHATPARAIGLFAIYVALCLTLPGTLLWRALTRLPSPPAVDLAAGTALGYALEIPLYLAARAAGRPGLVVLGPLAVIVVFLVRPRLRRHWRSTAAARVPAGAAAAMAGVFCFLVVSGALTFFGANGPRWPGNAAPHVDMPFHLALVAELRNHLPPTVPHVLGEPLSYHWFVYADMAAASWVTGIEAQTILYRLAILPMVAVSVVLLPATALMVTGRWRAGVLGLLITYFAGPLNPYSRSAEDFPGGPLDAVLAWSSPTHTFGAAIFAALALLVAALLRERAPGKAIFVPVAALLAALTGAKATYLPLLAAGVCLLAAVDRVRSRRVDRTLVTLGLLTLAALAFAQAVIFGGASQGLGPRPFSTAVRTLGKIVSGVDVNGPWAVPAALSLIFLLAWAVIWAGVFGPRPAPGSGADRTLTLFLGIGLGGVAAVTLLGHPGLSQFYFLRAARPYLSIVAAAGVLAALATVPRRLRALVAGACVVAGGATAGAVRAAVPESPPDLAALGGVGFAVALALPWVLLCTVPAAALFLLRRAEWRRAAVILVIAGFSVPSVVQSTARALSPEPAPRRWEMPRAGLEAARWLRDHSGVDDVVATNAHCRFSSTYSSCDNRHFWISAYTERRILVEGWGYTPRTMRSLTDVDRQTMPLLPFWDSGLLAANDAVFTAPTAQAVGSLRERYGVRWLLVDGRRPAVSPDLGRFAELRHEKGRFAVYEITAGTPDGPWSPTRPFDYSTLSRRRPE
ncbi:MULTISPECIES: hypothetical protein [Streptosporangium]|uniref:Glycosyltransferase RgtA/B/C/D-like domain-containing protein n=1 Tax=Streptosporangium brasiliense TaxID=47480 RepID=A0ABT9R3D8_9ACTN|nr:hypothetical protein [Streptosporangium brasiliense]MDP9862970.1 hypothetical protein [Streptosporangium brasiliense]